MDKFIGISLAIFFFYQVFWQLTATIISGMTTGRVCGVKIQVCDSS